MTTPINQLIDKACGIGDDLGKAEVIGKAEVQHTHEELANKAAAEVINHIDTMYPAMWEGVPKSARTSVRNVVYHQVMMSLNLFYGIESNVVVVGKRRFQCRRCGRVKA